MILQSPSELRRPPRPRPPGAISLPGDVQAERAMPRAARAQGPLRAPPRTTPHLLRTHPSLRNSPLPAISPRSPRRTRCATSSSTTPPPSASPVGRCVCTAALLSSSYCVHRRSSLQLLLAPSPPSAPPDTHAPCCFAASPSHRRHISPDLPAGAARAHPQGQHAPRRPSQVRVARKGAPQLRPRSPADLPRRL